MAVLDLSRDDEIGEEQFLPELGCWFLFQCVDVQDVDGRWYESQIIELDDALNQVKIRFKGFHPKFDTNLSVDSDRIQLLHTYTHRPETHWDVDSPEELNSLIHVGTRLDAKDGTGAWFPASVIAKDSTHYMVKLHYQNWRSEFDEWINIDSYRLAPLHSMTIPLEREELGADAEQVALETKRNCMCLQNNPNRVKSSFKASISNEQRFREILKRKLDCEIVDMDNDGNCLFRSVSHQVYGDPAFHLVIRNKCMDYMESEADFFSRFTLGNDFGAYVSKLRRDGEWGDHVEIQAMSEIYDRPVEVYAYSESKFTDVVLCEGNNLNSWSFFL